MGPKNELAEADKTLSTDKQTDKQTDKHWVHGLRFDKQGVLPAFVIQVYMWFLIKHEKNSSAHVEKFEGANEFAHKYEDSTELT